MEHIQVDAGTGRWQLWVRWRDNTTAPSHMKNNLYLRLPVDRVEATGAVLQYMEALQVSCSTARTRPLRVARGACVDRSCGVEARTHGSRCIFRGIRLGRSA